MVCTCNIIFVSFGCEPNIPLGIQILVFQLNNWLRSCSLFSFILYIVILYSSDGKGYYWNFILHQKFDIQRRICKYEIDLVIFLWGTDLSRPSSAVLYQQISEMQFLTKQICLQRPQPFCQFKQWTFIVLRRSQIFIMYVGYFCS